MNKIQSCQVFCWSRNGIFSISSIYNPSFNLYAHDKITLHPIIQIVKAYFLHLRLYLFIMCLCLIWLKIYAPIINATDPIMI